jgi:hypothetical protein
MVDQLKSFSEVQYVTKNGEKCRAIKNDGIVTVVGDKSGVRQMSIEQFKKELIANIENVQLEKTPEKDAFSSTCANSLNAVTDNIKEYHDAYAKVVFSNPALFLASSLYNPVGHTVVMLNEGVKAMNKLKDLSDPQ